MSHEHCCGLKAQGGCPRGPVSSDWPFRPLGSHLGSPGQPAGGVSREAQHCTAGGRGWDGRDQPSGQQSQRR